jgi:hypothetical protein
MQLAYGTDPWNKASVNEPPSQLYIKESLSLQENSPAGTLIGKVYGVDPQGVSTLQFSMLPLYPTTINPLIWLDASDGSTLEVENHQVNRWQNKAERRLDFVQDNSNARPHAYTTKINHYTTVEFDGDDFLHSEGILSLDRSFTIVLVSKVDTINSTEDALFSLGSNHSDSAFHFGSNHSDSFRGHFSNNGMGKDHTFLTQPSQGPSIYELIFDYNQKELKCRLNGTVQGTTEYHTPPHPHHIFRLNSNLGVSEFTKGESAELFIFNSLLSDYEHRQLGTYLGTKWAIPVSNPLPEHLFEIKTDGSIFTTREFDFETDPNTSIQVRAIDDHNFSITQEFTVTLTNVVEDRDGDGIEDAYDFDFDNDGIEDEYDSDDDNDGFSDSYEIAYGSDPFNANSLANKKPVGLNLNGTNVLENAPLGTVVGKVLGEDPDVYDILTYKLVDGEGASSNSFFQLSSDGILRTKQNIDHEQSAFHSIRVRMEDPFGESLEKQFSLSVGNLYVPIAVTHRHVKNNGRITLQGETLENGGQVPHELGFHISTTANFADGNEWKSETKNSLTFSVGFTSLELGENYYYRAFARNSEGTAYGATHALFEPKPRWWLNLGETTSLGWIIDSWMGDLAPYPNRWVYHRRLGWIYMSPDGNNGYWLWRQENGWLWTNAETWPFLWSHESVDWLYLLPTKEKTLFYDYATGSLR